jgi:hypothetical protein
MIVRCAHDSLPQEPADHRPEIRVFVQAVPDSGYVVVELAQPVVVDVDRAVEQAGEVVV